MDPDALERWFEAQRRTLEEAYLAHEDPIDVAALLEANGPRPSGEAAGGEPAITRFAWADP